ncbi:FbpB family small basic protein [Halobacillus locisalis]|uniref:FbpB family small basic protein n=1 Tax=Halobacillus locisalis TaxID=220753 RepID=A0A838CQY6_9BACI|nr:FbpB family small basic protein [Halobacillus locisalis]MBA2174364.1 FbpB family small basic protein [Halobacillus locisalis]
MRPQRISFEHLVDRNKQQLLKDDKAIEKIEKQIDDKHTRKTDSASLVN